MTRVLILSEVGVYREALAKSVARDGRIEVVAVAANLDDAIAAVGNGRIEIFVVDTPMPRGADAVRALAAAAPEVKTVALGVPETERDVVALAEAGASGYVARDASIEDLVAVVDCVSRGEVLCPPEVAATLFRRVGMLARDRQFESIDGKLTARQLDVLRLIEEGFSNKQIASALSIELPTVKNHVHSILQKLNVHRRTEAAARARRHGVTGHLGG